MYSIFYILYYHLTARLRKNFEQYGDDEHQSKDEKNANPSA